MNFTDTVVQGPSSPSQSFVMLSNADISCDVARVTVTAQYDAHPSTPVGISTSDAGWSLVEQVHCRRGNLQGTNYYATQATFEKTAPGASESLSFSASYGVAAWGGSLSRISA